MVFLHSFIPHPSAAVPIAHAYLLTASVFLSSRTAGETTYKQEEVKRAISLLKVLMGRLSLTSCLCSAALGVAPYNNSRGTVPWFLLTKARRPGCSSKQEAGAAWRHRASLKAFLVANNWFLGIVVGNIFKWCFFLSSWATAYNRGTLSFLVWSPYWGFWKGGPDTHGLETASSEKSNNPLCPLLCPLLPHQLFLPAS